MDPKKREVDIYFEVKTSNLNYLHILDYGQPACAIIENEYGITPRSCLTNSEIIQHDNKQRLKLVQQSLEDAEQHYDIDGVSMTDDTIIV